MALFGGRRAPIDKPSETEVRSLLLREFAEEDADWLWHIDAARRIRNAEPPLVTATGRTAKELEGLPFLEVLAGPTWESGEFSRGLRLLATSLKEGEPFRDLRLPVYLKGEERWWEMSGAPRFDSDGTLLGYFGVVSDVTVQRASADKINRLARFDGLTGLPNRVLVGEGLERALAIAKQGSGECEIAAIAITNLNELKVSLGYKQSETLLVKVSERLSNFAGVDTMIGHVAPGEFVVAWVANADPKPVFLQIDELVREVTHVLDEGSPAALAWARATFPEDGLTGDELIAAALSRVYTAARAGERQPKHQSRSTPRAAKTGRIEAEDSDEVHRRAILIYGPQAEAGLQSLIEERRSRLHNNPPEVINLIELEQMEHLRNELQNLILLAGEGAKITKKLGVVATLARNVFKFSRDTGELFVAGLKPFLASAPLAIGTLVLLQAVCTPSIGAVAAPGAALAVLAGHYGLDLRRAKREREVEE